MCGIAGIFWSGAAPRNASSVVGRMECAIEHRGPDSSGRSSTDFAEIGFRRLSIIDLSSGDQPLRNEDGTVECFLNGEIYNYKALRRELEAEGHLFHTTSDTEVLPHLYEEHGTAMFRKLNGMFSIVVIDRKKREVLVARDHFGVKQAYYAVTPAGVVFGSEVKALLASGLFEPEVDVAGVLAYLTLFYCPGPQTLLKGVMKLPPGSFMSLRQAEGRARVEVQTYYELQARPRRALMSEADAVDCTAGLLGKAVELQLQADVSVGISLSGGLDSSTVAYAATQAMASSTGPRPVAVSINWPNGSPEELACARELCHGLGLEHVVLEPEHGDVLADLPDLAWMADEPVADPALYSQWCVAKAARAHAKVLLGGAGADELFGGYGWHKLSRRNRLANELPGGLGWLAMRWMHRGDADRLEAAMEYRQSRASWHCVAMQSLGREGRALVAEAIPGSRDPFTQIRAVFDKYRAYDGPGQQMIADLYTYLGEQILPMTDRATMAASIEGRVPFLDVPLVEFAFSLGGRVKLGSPEVSKRLLKLAFDGKVPASIINRRKSGMPSPFGMVIGNQHDGIVRHILLGKDAWLKTLLPTAWIEGMLRDRQSANANFRVLYSMLLLEAWHRVYIVGRKVSRPGVPSAEFFGFGGGRSPRATVRKAPIAPARSAGGVG